MNVATKNIFSNPPRLDWKPNFQPVTHRLFYFTKTYILSTRLFESKHNSNVGAVVVAQLVEWLLPNREVRSLNPVIDKIYIECLPSTVLKRQK